MTEIWIWRNAVPKEHRNSLLLIKHKKVTVRTDFSVFSIIHHKPHQMLKKIKTVEFSENKWTNYFVVAIRNVYHTTLHSSWIFYLSEIMCQFMSKHKNIDILISKTFYVGK